MTSVRLSQVVGEVFVPAGGPEAEALASTTHLGIGAHPDDLELMTWHPIRSCFRQADRGFTGVVVTDGAGSPRVGPYASCSDQEMRAKRLMEQKAAATLGEYRALVYLGFSSEAVKTAGDAALAGDLSAVLRACRPEVVYTHSLFDGHETHVAVAVHALRAIRELPAEQRPTSVYGCEVWGGLDWLAPEDRVVLDVSGDEDLPLAMIRAHDSQIAGGKRYDLATAGRRKAHATYSESHATDQHEGLIWGMDLTPLVQSAEEPETLAVALIRRFEGDVTDRIRRLF